MIDIMAAFRRWLEANGLPADRFALVVAARDQVAQELAAAAIGRKYAGILLDGHPLGVQATSGRIGGIPFAVVVVNPEAEALKAAWGSPGATPLAHDGYWLPPRFPEAGDN